MSDHDCLIWAGHSFLTIQDYLHEVRDHGCSCKVPFWPAWALPGQTRVFLAHHEGAAAPDRGVIFGYFVLAGVDVVVAPDDGDEVAVVPPDRGEADEGCRVRWEGDKAGRPTFYFVDALARSIDHDEEPLEEVEPAPATLRPCERRCGAMVTFKAPYPFYRSIPYASFRGLVQIDGDALLGQIEKVSRHRSKCHEVQLPYAVERSDPGTSKRKEELIVDMSVELKLSKSYAERVLDWLPEMMADELRRRSVIRLPNVGTFRLKSASADAGSDDAPSEAAAEVDYSPSRAFEREFGEIEFKPSRTLARRA